MAINKFKGLISKSRMGTPELRSPRTPRTLEIPGRIYDISNRVHELSSRIQEASGHIHEATQIKTHPVSGVPGPESESETEPRARPRQKSVAEEAAELVAARKAYLASTRRPGIPEGDEQTQDPTQGGPAHFLGIGLGAGEDPVAPEAPVDVVSDSPTGIDFNIYDRAFEAEMERIRSEKHSNRSTTYLTRFVKEKEKYLDDDCMIVEAGRNFPGAAMNRASSAAARTLSHMGLARREATSSEPSKDASSGSLDHLREALDVKKTEVHESVQNTKEKGFRFADLVMGTMQSARSKISGEPRESS